jgi:hypothetical protein
MGMVTAQKNQPILRNSQQPQTTFLEEKKLAINRRDSQIISTIWPS